jgi:hypothetical protein
MENRNISTDISDARSPLVKWTLTIFFAGLVVFGATFAGRLGSPSTDNHYVYLADGFLHGRLHLEGKPPHRNDWAKYNGKWYVSFPPAPAVLMLPGVWLFGMDFNDRIFTLFFDAAGPALLFLLLMLLKKRGSIDRKPWELALVTAVFGVGTVYYFAAVQGTVWYAAHMVGTTMMLLYMLAALEARHPILAGFALGAAFACRPPMLLAAPFFAYELLQPHMQDGVGLLRSVPGALKHAGIKKIAGKILLFLLPIAIILGLLMAMNAARFDDPFEFGHRHLQVRWTGRILKWGLFHYHYLSRNLAVAFTLLPWLSTHAPHLQIGNHGLAIWFTTPVLIYLLWPKALSRFYVVLALTALFVAIPSLLYQNSGWLQFGYRFSLDYMPYLIVMLAACGRKFNRLFIGLCVVALVVNLFGAVTFDRFRMYYPRGESATALFQPN